MSAISGWRKLKKLSRKELKVLLQAVVLLPLIALLMKFLGFRRLYGTMAKLSHQPNRGETQLLGAKVTNRLVEIASRYGLYRANCLQKSLVLWWLLRWQDMESELRIGVRKQEGLLEAHAWIEYQGCVLNDRSDVDQRFAPFAGAIQSVGVKIL